MQNSPFLHCRHYLSKITNTTTTTTARALAYRIVGTRAGGGYRSSLLNRDYSDYRDGGGVGLNSSAITTAATAPQFGLFTFCNNDSSCIMMVMDSRRPHGGIGFALIAAIILVSIVSASCSWVLPDQGAEAQ